MFLQQLFVKGLGHASYLLGDEGAGVAAVIDPRRDIDAYLELARADGLPITDISRRTFTTTTPPGPMCCASRPARPCTRRSMPD